jgi:hypothetical protein
MIKIYKTPKFSQWLTDVGLTDKSLTDAVNEMVLGLIDADLGGGLYKKRIALPGRGKRAGARTIVASYVNNKWFFLFAFAKNERDNISQNEKTAFQVIAHSLFALDEKALEKALSDKKLVEVLP